MGFPGGSDSKESACNVENLGLIPGLGRSPGEGYGNPFQYSCQENPHGQRSLAGYSPRGRTESDTTEQPRTLIGPEAFPRLGAGWQRMLSRDTGQARCLSQPQLPCL